MSKKKYQFVVVIINYKTPYLILNCLESLLPELHGLSAKVIVVDNNSHDGSDEIIQYWIEYSFFSGKVELISSLENTGFSGGNNLGIQHIKADYYLLLNSDTLIRKGAIKLLLNAAKENEKAGLISPRLEWLNGDAQESCFRFHSPLSELISSANTGIITKCLRKFNVPQPVSEVANYYDWTSFACVLVKSDVFDDIGMMDDGYFMYFEDVAFSFHSQQAGWKVLNVPDAHVVHLRGGSSPVKSQAKQRKRLPRYYYESRTRYFYQSYGWFGLFNANLLWTLGFGLSLLRRLISPSLKLNVSAYQWRDIWTNFFSPLRMFIHPDDYDKT